MVAGNFVDEKVILCAESVKSVQYLDFRPRQYKIRLRPMVQIGAEAGSMTRSCAAQAMAAGRARDAPQL
jgi:hypothetical protein